LACWELCWNNVDKSESIVFLQKISQVVKPQTEPYVLIVMETAAYQLSLDDVLSCKKGTPSWRHILSERGLNTFLFPFYFIIFPFPLNSH